MSEYVRDLVPPGLPRVVLGLAAVTVFFTVAIAVFH
jgi:hypothetical protein